MLELSGDDMRVAADRVLREQERASASLSAGAHELAGKKLYDMGLSPDSEYGQRLLRNLGELDSALQRLNRITRASLQAIRDRATDGSGDTGTAIES